MKAEIKEGMTCKQMCEHIAKSGLIPKFKTGIDVWEGLPNGEIYILFIWYEDACLLIGD